MNFDLINGWFDSAVGKDVTQHADWEVRNTDIFDFASIVEGFHCLPGLMNWYGIFIHTFAPVVDILWPCWWVNLVKWDIFQRDWEMDEVEVEVTTLQVSQGSLEADWNMLLSVASVPQLGSDEEFLSLNNSIIERLLDSITNFLFVTVMDSLIKASVSILNGSVYNISALFVWDLPASQTNEWHGASTVCKRDFLWNVSSCFHLYLLCLN